MIYDVLEREFSRGFCGLLKRLSLIWAIRFSGQRRPIHCPTDRPAPRHFPEPFARSSKTSARAWRRRRSLRRRPRSRSGRHSRGTCHNYFGNMKTSLHAEEFKKCVVRNTKYATSPLPSLNPIPYASAFQKETPHERPNRHSKTPRRKALRSLP